MTKTAKIFYWVASILYVLATIYEIYIYMSMESNYVGIFYLFLSFFVMFLMLTVSYNYDRASVKHRISKNIIAISVGLFSSYIISLILPHVMGYEDASRMFINNTSLCSIIVKPVIYLGLGIITFLEYRRFKTGIYKK